MLRTLLCVLSLSLICSPASAGTEAADGEPAEQTLVGELELDSATNCTIDDPFLICDYQCRRDGWCESDHPGHWCYLAPGTCYGGTVHQCCVTGSGL